MRDKRIILGIGLGFCLAVGFLFGRDGYLFRFGPEATGAILSDCSGAIRSFVVQYTRQAGPIVMRTYQDFLSRMDSDVTVYVVCPDAVDWKDFCFRLGKVSCRMVPVITHHPITAWSRDRWIAFSPYGRNTRTTILFPREENASTAWSERIGDGRVAEDIAAAEPVQVVARRSDFFFDGGDFDADDNTIFVTPALLERNLQHTVDTRKNFLLALTRLTKRRVLLLDGAPNHHTGMYMMPVGNRTILVGDPGLAAELLKKSGLNRVMCSTAGGDDFSQSTATRFETVANLCTAAGYRVVRIPVVPGKDSRTYLTYVNAIMDVRGGKRVVYMPSYAHAGPLNKAATETWQSVGYEVRPVDCTLVFPHFGALHCLVNVLQRS